MCNRFRLCIKLVTKVKFSNAYSAERLFVNGWTVIVEPEFSTSRSSTFDWSAFIFEWPRQTLSHGKVKMLQHYKTFWNVHFMEDRDDVWQWIERLWKGRVPKIYSEHKSPTNRRAFSLGYQLHFNFIYVNPVFSFIFLPYHWLYNSVLPPPKKNIKHATTAE